MNQKHFYDFDGFRIDAEERLLLRDGEIIPLTQKAFDVLFVLVKRNNRLVTKEELMNEVWPDTFVEEGNLAQNIYTLRKALGTPASGEDYIKTVPRRGYRFVATVEEKGAEEIEIPTAELLRLIDLKEKQLTEKFPETEAATIARLKDFGSPEPAPVPESFAPAPAPAVPASNSKRLWVGLGILLAIALIAGWLAFRERRSAPPFENLSISNITTAGNVQCIAVSPDGKFAVFGRADKTYLSSLNLLQLSNPSPRVIVPAEEVRYHAVTISPDNSSVYFVRVRNDVPNRMLSRVPLFGGEVQKLLDDVETAVAFSPDGKQIAFRRGSNERRKSVLYVANADGTAEREVATIDYPSTFNDPAWSPDGKVIACPAGHAEGGKNRYVVAVRTSDWTMRTITPENWQWIGQVAWLPGSSGLVMLGKKEGSDPIQIWRLSYPSGKIERLTNDANSYNRLSMSADGRLIAALQIKRTTSMWIAPIDNLGRAQQITFGAGGYRGHLSWTPDARIVFESEAGNRTAITVMEMDGSNQRHLAGEAGEVNGYPAATPDGRYILYFSDLSGVRHIWRMNADGGNPIQITSGRGEDHPAATPDGKWVVFTQKEMTGLGKPTLWKVPIDGGRPVQLTDGFTGVPAVSPDGKLVACSYSPNTGLPGQLAVFSFVDGRLLKLFPQPLKGEPLLRWMPDGQGIAYVDYPVGPSRLWLQPLAGGPPKSLLEIDTDQIFGFDWSPDGKQLAYVRGFWAQNIVTIRDLR
jgi:Tol biopolymer transport system component/DNA-binding winged helix-turn-helix (wHTH) protein